MTTMLTIIATIATTVATIAQYITTIAQHVHSYAGGIAIHHTVVDAEISPNNNNPFHSLDLPVRYELVSNETAIADIFNAIGGTANIPQCTNTYRKPWHGIDQ